MLRRSLLALAAVVSSASALALATPAHAAGPPAPAPELACGADVSTSVTLTRDLACSGRPITVVADGVTIDLGGHTVTYTNLSQCYAQDRSRRCAVSFDGRGGTIKNGILRGGGPSNAGAFYAERLGRPAHGSAGLLIDQVTVEDGDVILESAAQSADRGNQLRQSIVNRGRVWLIGAHNVVHQNWVVHGSIVLDHNRRWLRDTAITGNIVAFGPGNGLELALYPYGPNDVSGEISGNIFYGNAGAGISIGRHVQNLGRLDVARNLVMRNGTEGIAIRGTSIYPYAGGPVTLTGNTAQENKGVGIDATWTSTASTGIADGGGNRATSNKAPQCLGVTCSDGSLPS